MYDSSLAVCSFSLIQASISSTSRLNCCRVCDSPSFDLFSIIWAFRRRQLQETMGVKVNVCLLGAQGQQPDQARLSWTGTCPLNRWLSAPGHLPVQNLVTAACNVPFGIMASGNELISKGLQGSDLLLLGGDKRQEVKVTRELLLRLPSSEESGYSR